MRIHLWDTPEQRQILTLWLVVLLTFVTDVATGAGISYSMTDERVQDAAVRATWTGDVVLLAVLLGAVIASAQHRGTWARRLIGVYLAAMVVHLIAYLAILVVDAGEKPEQPLYALWDVALFYFMTIEVFTVIYCVFDVLTPGGAFLFPIAPGSRSQAEVKPTTRHMFHYFFIAFNVNSTFGPTTEAPSHLWVKLLMILQAIIAIIVIVIIVARLTM